MSKPVPIASFVPPLAPHSREVEPAPTDAIERAIAGDPDAIASLLRAMRPTVVAVVRRPSRLRLAKEALRRRIEAEGLLREALAGEE